MNLFIRFPKAVPKGYHQKYATFGNIYLLQEVFKEALHLYPLLRIPNTECIASSVKQGSRKILTIDMPIKFHLKMEYSGYIPLLRLKPAMFELQVQLSNH